MDRGFCVSQPRHFILISWLSCTPVTPVILTHWGTRQPRYKTFWNYCYIASVVFRGCWEKKTKCRQIPAIIRSQKRRVPIWSLYCGCCMAPQQVKFRFPRRRNLPAIIRSLLFSQQISLQIQFTSCCGFPSNNYCPRVIHYLLMRVPPLFQNNFILLFSQVYRFWMI